jgi:hypothetical protein
MQRPGRFTAETDTRFRKVVRSQDQAERVRKFSPLPGLYPQTVRPVAGRYFKRSRRIKMARMKKISSGLNMWNASYRSVLNILSSSLLRKT